MESMFYNCMNKTYIGRKDIPSDYIFHNVGWDDDNYGGKILRVDPIRVIRDHHVIKEISKNGNNNEVRRVDIEFVKPNFFGNHTILYNQDFRDVKNPNRHIYDYYQPYIFNVACKGLKYPTKYKDINGDYQNYPEYNIWYDMISRCVYKGNKNYSTYGEKGISVIYYWLCYEIFYDTLPLVENFLLWRDNPGKYDLDKDTKQIGVPDHLKIYSIDTCRFITKRENALEAADRRGNKSGYRGAILTPYNTYSVEYNGIKYGHYKDLRAAASMYNYILMENGVSTGLNVIENGMMPYDECLNYKSKK